MGLKTRDKKFGLSKTTTCGHCNNIAAMEILGKADLTDFQSDEDGSFGGYSGDIYEVLECPKCEKRNIVGYFWHDFMESNDEISYELLYPPKTAVPQGLPEEILKLYIASEQIKHIDAGIYAITLRKVLEMVCSDKKAEGSNLADKLKDMAKKGEIPKNLVKVGEHLRHYGNAGAHDTSISTQEIHMIEALCKAVLEYIYTAPYLADLAQKKLETLKKKKPKIS